MKKATLLLLLFLAAPSIKAQQQSIDDLKKEIQALNETVKAMQKDLQEIKSLLVGRMPPAPPENVVLNLEGAPFRGNPQAPLTMIEFSDFE